MKLHQIAPLCILLASCATFDATKTHLAVATHADLQAAAKYASDHGYPARAAVWMAEDSRLSAVEAQINACAKAIAESMPKGQPNGAALPTPFLAVEIAAEAVGTYSGVPPAVQINCAAFPIVVLPPMPKP